MRELLPIRTPILEEEWVALDLETTGLSPKSETIIEVGAVRFRGDKILDTFSTFVNPERRLSKFIIDYTGITQSEVDGAPLFADVLPNLTAFIGSAPLVGHNIKFDLDFLTAEGLHISNPTSDTWDLAFVLRPAATSYKLANIAADLGLIHDRPHRATDDATITAKVFFELIKIAEGLEIDLLTEIERATSRSRSMLSYVVSSLAQNRLSTIQTGESRPSIGFDISSIRSRLQRLPAMRPSGEANPIDVEAVNRILGEQGSLSSSMPSFEYRPEQVAMASAVAEALNAPATGGNGRLIVEAGTGVGKSLAYLLPAVLYALKNNANVVVSTNTINLQEQLLNKDLPVLLQALESATEEGLQVEALRATQLKGRSNYLCLNKLFRLRANDFQSESDARMLSKLLVWLRSTEIGDRAEINIGANAANIWERLSAQGASDCTGASGVCFLRAARERAASAHLIIVNHALLMADLTTDGSILPEHEVLIIDEAHHLEESATRQLAFEVSQTTVHEHLNKVVGDGGLLNSAASVLRAETIASSRRQTVAKIVENASNLSPTIREETAKLLATAGKLSEATANDSQNAVKVQEARITNATRAQPIWSDLEVSWERVDLALSELSLILTRLLTALDDLDQAELPGYDGLILDATELSHANEQIRDRLSEFFPHPKKDNVYWVSNSIRHKAGGRKPEVGLHAAPLQVGKILAETVYSRTDTVVMTSATLATDGTFDHLIDRTGFDNAETLLLGSPFDYQNAALVCLPKDLPEPSSWAYQDAVEQAIVDATVASKGHAMVLFTSYSSLNRAAKSMRATLSAHDITVLAQGIDGTPKRIIDAFLSNPRSVILGTSSFWEGVDFAGESLQVLMVARLPFSVPTDPIFAARSELFEDSFRQYSVPEAVLRLRQGFGRLIRTNNDRGVVIILDRRIVSKGYGKTFTRSLPPATFAHLQLAEVPKVINDFLGRDRQAN